MPEGRDAAREISSIKAHMSDRVSAIGTSSNSGWGGIFSEIKSDLERRLSQCIGQSPETCVGTRKDPGPLVFVGASLDIKDGNPTLQQQQSFWDKVDSEYEESTVRSSETPESTDGKLPTPEEVQRDSSTQVPMSMTQAKTMARKMNHQHLAEPGGSPDQLSEKSMSWPLDSGGLRPMLLDLADKIDAVTSLAIKDVKARIKSPKLFNDFVYDMGVTDHPDVDGFKSVWGDITDSMVKMIGSGRKFDSISVFTFSDILRKFATGEGRTRVHFRKRTSSTGETEWSYDPVPGNNPGAVVDPSLYMIWSNIATDDISDMTMAMRDEASTLADAATKASGQIDPEGELHGIMAGDIIMNTPKFVKGVITGENTVDKAIDQFAKTLVHEFDHVIYAMLWGSEAMVELDGSVVHGVAHDMAAMFDSVVDNLYYGRSARVNASDFFETKDGRPPARRGEEFGMEAIRERRAKNIEKFIDRKMWQSGNDPEHAYNALVRKGFKVFNVDEHLENIDGKGADDNDFSRAVRGATEIQNYVFKRADGTYEFGNPYDFQPIGDALDEQSVVNEQARPATSGDGSTIGAGQSDTRSIKQKISDERAAEKERQKGKGVSGGLGGVPSQTLGVGQSWGEGMNSRLAYNDPFSPFNAQEFNAKLAQVKRGKYEGALQSLGMSDNYIWTLDELKKFARANINTLEGALGDAGLVIGIMIKAPEELNDESLEAFNSIGQLGASISPEEVEKEVPAEKERREAKNQKENLKRKTKIEKTLCGRISRSLLRN